MSFYSYLTPPGILASYSPPKTPTSITETAIPTPADGITLAPTKSPPIPHAPTVVETHFPTTPKEAGAPTSVEGIGMDSLGMPKSDKKKSKGKDSKV